ncbi:hypothetical protein QTP88_008762 [Uroleucon formosanum]
MDSKNSAERESNCELVFKSRYKNEYNTRTRKWSNSNNVHAIQVYILHMYLRRYVYCIAGYTPI